MTKSKAIIKNNEVYVDYTMTPETAKDMLKFLKGAINEYEACGNHFTTPYKFERLKWFYECLVVSSKHPVNHIKYGKVVRLDIPKGIVKNIQLLTTNSITPYSFEFQNRNW